MGDPIYATSANPPSSGGGHYRPDLQEAKGTETVLASMVAPNGYTSATAVPVSVQPTQVRRPWRATLRTFVQALIPTILALALVVPEVVKIILDETGEAMPEKFRLVLLGISGAVAAVAAILARVMAIPAVEMLLRRYIPGLSAAPKEK